MNKIYSLLRSNKQMGPYTLEELLQLQLKPLDLVWVEGRSAGWSYPSEIDHLKSFVSDTSVKTPKAIVEEVEVIPRTEMVRARPVQEPITHSPEHGKHIYISLPAKNEVEEIQEVRQAQPVATVAALLSQEENLPQKEETFEERVQRMRNKLVEVDNNSLSVVEAEPVEETKYARSLDDIKHEYSSWMYRQRKKQRFSINKKAVGLVALTLMVIASGFFLWRWMENRNVMSADEKNTPTSTGKTTGTTSVRNEEPYISSTSAKDDPSYVSSTEEKNKLRMETKSPVVEKETKDVVSITNPPSDKIKDEAPEVLKKEDKKQVTVQEPVRNTKAEEEQKTVPVEDKKRMPLNQLIQVNSKTVPSDDNGLGGMKITVKNISDQLLKVVAVDVFYHTEEEKPLAKKTIYFSNIKPGQSITLTAPGNSKASGAYHKLGLVSSEEGGLYVNK